jgi:hypothetical protein
MQADLQKLSNLLDGMPEQSPPPELADRILEQLPLLDRRPTFSLAGWFSSLQPAPLGLAFAAGLLLTVGVYEMSPGHRSETDPASIVGTMVANMQSQPASQKDSLVISTPGLSGTVSLSSSGHLQVLNFGRQVSRMSTKFMKSWTAHCVSQTRDDAPSPYSCSSRPDRRATIGRFQLEFQVVEPRFFPVCCAADIPG